MIRSVWPSLKVCAIQFGSSPGSVAVAAMALVADVRVAARTIMMTIADSRHRLDTDVIAKPFRMLPPKSCFFPTGRFLVDFLAFLLMVVARHRSVSTTLPFQDHVLLPSPRSGRGRGPSPTASSGALDRCQSTLDLTPVKHGRRRRTRLRALPDRRPRTRTRCPVRRSRPRPTPATKAQATACISQSSSPPTAGI
jgi:hypothetical protein